MARCKNKRKSDVKLRVYQLAWGKKTTTTSFRYLCIYENSPGRFSCFEPINVNISGKIVRNVSGKICLLQIAMTVHEIVRDGRETTTVPGENNQHVHLATEKLAERPFNTTDSVI